MIRGDYDLLHPERCRRRHPVIGVQIGRVEHIGLEAGVVTLGLIAVVG